MLTTREIGAAWHVVWITLSIAGALSLSGCDHERNATKDSVTRMPHSDLPSGDGLRVLLARWQEEAWCNPGWLPSVHEAYDPEWIVEKAREGRIDLPSNWYEIVVGLTVASVATSADPVVSLHACLRLSVERRVGGCDPDARIRSQALHRVQNIVDHAGANATLSLEILARAVLDADGRGDVEWLTEALCEWDGSSILRDPHVARAVATAALHLRDPISRGRLGEIITNLSVEEQVSILSPLLEDTHETGELAFGYWSRVRVTSPVRERVCDMAASHLQKLVLGATDFDRASGQFIRDRWVTRWREWIVANDGRPKTMWTPPP